MGFNINDISDLWTLIKDNNDVARAVSAIWENGDGTIARPRYIGETYFNTWSEVINEIE